MASCKWPTQMDSMVFLRLFFFLSPNVLSGHFFSSYLSLMHCSFQWCLCGFSVCECLRVYVSFLCLFFGSFLLLLRFVIITVCFYFNLFYYFLMSACFLMRERKGVDSSMCPWNRDIQTLSVTKYTQSPGGFACNSFNICKKYNSIQ